MKIFRVFLSFSQKCFLVHNSVKLFLDLPEEA
jgi:hypothetical protein